MSALSRIPAALAVLALFACAPKAAAAKPETARHAPAAAPAKPVDTKADLDWRGSIERGATLHVATVSGDVRVTRARGGKARVRGFKSGKDAADVRIVVDEDARRVSIHPKYPRRNNSKARVDFIVEVPRDVEFEAEVVAGNIDSRGVGGALQLTSVEGDIRAVGSSNVAASTVSGTVVVRMPTNASRAQLEAVNGSLEVHLPAELGARVRAATLNGRIRSDFPLQRKNAFVGAQASTTIGDGKARVSLETVNGGIAIRKG